MPNWTKEQLDAINKDNTNIIVSAGAGSGKTAVLSQRVIRKLNQGININELLILTFTNAAAKEMKERIRKKIKSDSNLKKQLDLIDQSYITTFDSFSLSIVKKYHYLLNVSKDISIIDSSLIRLQKEKILDEIFNNYYENNDPLFEKLIGDFCTKDDKEIREYILNINDKLDLKVEKEEYLNNYINEFFNEGKINNDIKLFEELLINKINEIKDNLYSISFLVENTYYQKLNDSLSKLIGCNNYEEILNNIDIKLPTLPRNSKEEVKTLKENISNILKELKELCKYDNKDNIKEYILKTKDYITIIIDIISLLDKKINEYKFKYDMYEFNDIAIMAINLLKNNEDIRKEVKNSFNEIMIDEYQDTSDIQEEFISLIENNNVYMVGDIKQSIYRFRNANPYIFKNKYDKYSNNDGGIKIDLNKNFRSRKEVLDNINLIFNYIMDDFIGGANYKLTHNMIFGNNTYINEGLTKQNNNIEIYNYDYDKESKFTKEEIECFIVGNDIKQKLENNYKIFDKDTLTIRNSKYSDFVILIDRSTNFELYKKIFEYLGLPLTIYQDEKITEDIILSILKNIISLVIKVYENNIDNEFKYNFISVSRSFVINMSDEEIFSYFKNNNFNESDLYKTLDEISSNIDSLSIKEIVNLIIDKFDIVNKLVMVSNINSNIVKIDYILNLVDNFSSLGYTLKDFKDYLNEIIEKNYDIKFSENINDENSIKIMTIHKSKGLEFHICYYPNLYPSFNISELKEKFIFDNKYQIISPVFDEGIDTTIYKELLKNNYIKEEISEKIRLFYVALTRAKEKMILIMNNNEENIDNKDNDIINASVRLKYRSFKDLVISIKDLLTDNIVSVDIDKLNITKDYNLIKKNNYEKYITKTDKKININELNIDNTIINEESFSKKENKLISKEENDNMLLGSKVHYILETLDFREPNMQINDSFIKEKIDKFLNNDILKNINNAKIYKEYEFMYEKENTIYHGIIDLMLVYNDHIDIIDYKLKNITDEEYKKQLLGYKNYIENKLNKKTNIYLYSIFDGQLLEI